MSNVQEPNALDMVATWLTQRVCGVRGHDSVKHFEGKRVMMRCTNCGHTTPGWETGARPPRQRFAGDAARHVLVGSAKS